jgi:predicted lipoprotein with Yx(FWY)xxD motif
MFVLVGLVLVACAGAPQASPTSAPSTAPPTASPTTAPTEEPTDAPTSTPEPTEAPTDTAAPSATATAPAEPSASATSAAGVVIGIEPDGGFLITPDGYSLYTFDDDDTPGESACNGECAENWPPLVLPAGMSASGGEGVTGTFSTITRGDGSLQVTYNDAPLYFYAGDNEPGETEGDGLGGVWHLAEP